MHSYLSGHNTKYELSRTYFIHTDLFPHQPRDKLLIPGDPRARGVEDTLLPGEVDPAPDPRPHPVQEGGLDAGHAVLRVWEGASEVWQYTGLVGYNITKMCVSVFDRCSYLRFCT